MKAEAIRDFLRRRLIASAKRRGVDESLVTDDARTIEAGIIDSMGFVELITEIEEKFGLRIDFSAVDPERFTTVDGLLEIAEGKETK